MNLLAVHEHFADMGPLEWATAAVAGLVAAWVIYLCVRHALRPGEEQPDHIKRSILDEEPAPLASDRVQP